MSVSLSLYIVLHFFVDLLCQINLPLEKNQFLPDIRKLSKDCNFKVVTAE